MKIPSFIVAAASVSVASARFASPRAAPPSSSNDTGVNPFEGKTHYVNPSYAAKLNETREAFLAQNDTLNAARTRAVEDVGTFVWVSSMSELSNIDEAITQARLVQEEEGEEQIVGLVLYDLPNRDCSAGESAGEFDLEKDGLNRYKKEFVDPYVEAVSQADDLTFAIMLEPDSLGNAITNTGIEFCNASIPAYKEGIAYAISELQFDHVSLYIDAAHGGWLGWEDNLEPSMSSKSIPVHVARVF